MSARVIPPCRNPVRSYPSPAHRENGRLDAFIAYTLFGLIAIGMIALSAEDHALARAIGRKLGEKARDRRIRRLAAQRNNQARRQRMADLGPSHPVPRERALNG